MSVLGEFVPEGTIASPVRESPVGVDLILTQDREARFFGSPHKTASLASITTLRADLVAIAAVLLVVKPGHCLLEQCPRYYNNDDAFNRVYS